VAEGWRKTCGVPGSCYWRQWLCRSSPQMNLTPALPKLTSCLVVATCALTNSKSGNYLHHTAWLKLLAWTPYKAKCPQPHFTFIHFGHISRGKGDFESKIPDLIYKHFVGLVLLLQFDNVKRMYQSRGIGTLTKVLRFVILQKYNGCWKSPVSSVSLEPEVFCTERQPPRPVLPAAL